MLHEDPWQELHRIIDVQKAEGMRPTFPASRVAQLSRRESEEMVLAAAWALSYYRHAQPGSVQERLDL